MELQPVGYEMSFYITVHKHLNTESFLSPVPCKRNNIMVTNCFSTLRTTTQKAQIQASANGIVVYSDPESTVGRIPSLPTRADWAPYFELAKTLQRQDSFS